MLQQQSTYLAVNHRLSNTLANRRKNPSICLSPLPPAPPPQFFIINTWIRNQTEINLSQVANHAHLHLACDWKVKRLLSAGR